MRIELSVFGAFRDFVPEGHMALDVGEGTDVGSVRAAFAAHAAAHWPTFNSGLLASSAFASEVAVLRDADPVPADGKLAVLPPVSGG